MSVLLFPVCKYFLSNLPASSLLPFQSILHTTKENSYLQGPGKKAPPKCKSKRESSSGRKPGNKSYGLW